MSKTVLYILLLGFAFALSGCSNGEEPEKSGIRPMAGAGVARVTLDGGGFDLRKPGAVTFEPVKGMMDLERGSTLRTRSGIVTLNFLGSDVIQVSAKSEIILEGRVDTGRGLEHVLGLQAGEVVVNPNADYPMVLKMPHAEVRSLRAYFSVAMKRDAKGKYSADITAFGKDVRIKNAKGTLNLPSGGMVRVDEREPPVLLKNQKALRRRY